MGKDDNRRTFKMKRKKAQAAKKARLKARMSAVKAPTKTAKKQIDLKVCSQLGSDEEKQGKVDARTSCT